MNFFPLSFLTFSLSNFINALKHVVSCNYCVDFIDLNCETHKLLGRPCQLVVNSVVAQHLLCLPKRWHLIILRLYSEKVVTPLSFDILIDYLVSDLLFTVASFILLTILLACKSYAV